MLIPDLYLLFLKHPSVCIDTRTISPGCIFFCIHGESFDGNTFAHKALELGAAYVVSDDAANVHPNIVLVDSVLETLQLLAAYHRSKINFPVIGITGSNGKTTSKELISHLLMAKYKVAFTKGNFNNHIGVPLTLLSIAMDDEIAVVEMGANHPGEIQELCDIVNPDFGIITNIGSAHLEGFGGLQGVINTKKALYDSISKRNGVLFVNGNDDLLMELSDGVERIVYGTKSGFLVGDIDQKDPFLSVNIPNASRIFETNLIGTYNLPNILAAVAIARYFKIDFSDIQKSLKEYVPSNNRSQLLKTERNEIFMDAYNANPSSMKVAIEHFLSLNKVKKVAILGEMRELGEYSQQEHALIIETMNATSDVDIYYVGDEFVKTHHQSKGIAFSTPEQALVYFETHALSNSYILLKGSRGIKLETLLPQL